MNNPTLELTPNQAKERTKIVRSLWLLVLIFGGLVSWYELEAVRPDMLSLYGLIPLANLGGIMLFYYSAELMKKNKLHGRVAFAAAVFVRFIFYVYAAFLGGYWGDAKVGVDEAVIIAFSNTIILILEALVNAFSQIGEESRLKEVELNRREAEIQERVIAFNERERGRKISIAAKDKKINEMDEKIVQAGDKLLIAYTQIEELKKANAELDGINDKYLRLKKEYEKIAKFVEKPFRSATRIYYIDPTDKTKPVKYFHNSDVLELGSGEWINKEGKITKAPKLNGAIKA